MKRTPPRRGYAPRNPVLLALVALSIGACDQPAAEGPAESNEVPAPLKLDLHVMSKCPFGNQLLSELVPVVKALSGEVDLEVHYVGRRVEGGWESLYGESDLAADKVQLCAAEEGNEAAWLSFLACQAKDPASLPDGWDECATGAGLAADSIRKCAAGKKGQELLTASFERSASKGVKQSPALWIDGVAYDGGRSADFLARALCADEEVADTSYCKALPTPTEIEVVVIKDDQCEDPSCATQQFEGFVQRTLAGAKVELIDWSDPKGAALFERSGKQHLPVVWFSASLAKDARVLARLERAGLAHAAQGDGYFLPLGTNHEPTASKQEPGETATNAGSGG